MKKPLFALILLLAFFTFTGSLVKAQENVHRIKSGETLSLLARKYKTSVGELIRLNPEAAKGLRAGADLKLPVSSKPAEPSNKQQAVAFPQVSEKKHRVASGESLSRIAKKYKVSVSELETWNQMKASALRAGQEILVSPPLEPKANPSSTGADNHMGQPDSPEPSETHAHIVFKGETLSSIAQKEGTSVDAIRKLNQLKGDQLKLGQALLIPGPAKGGENASSLSQKQVVKPSEGTARQESTAKSESNKPAVINVPEEPVRPADEVTAKTEIPVSRDVKPTAGIREVNNVLGYTRIVETGFAESIEGDPNSKKHLCLHKSAPVGSILQVKNEVNGQSVFVKVIGKLPETGSNEKIIIRISRQAYERLMASGKRFPVEVSYPEAQP